MAAMVSPCLQLAAWAGFGLLVVLNVRAESLPTPRALNADEQAFVAAQATAAEAVISAEDRRTAKAIAAHSARMVESDLERAQAEPGTDAANESKLSIRIFVSQSLPRADQAAAIALAQADPRITLVFRGLLPATRLADLKHWLAELLGPLAHLKHAPRIEIDPPAFRAAGIAAVPVVALYRDDHLQSQVAGMLDPGWLEAQWAEGQTGPFPVRGPTYTIAEVDLIELMQAKARAIDWQAWQRQQRAALYRSLNAQVLPNASITQVRWHDPSFVVQEHILAQGQVIAEAGTRVNPLDTLPFTQELWVIDATNAGQWQLAMQWQHARATQANSPRITVLTTALPETDSLAWLDARSRELGQAIQLWRADFTQAFGIHVVPTRLRAEQGRFRLEEFNVPADLGVQHADRQKTP